MATRSAGEDSFRTGRTFRGVLFVHLPASVNSKVKQSKLNTGNAILFRGSFDDLVEDMFVAIMMFLL